MGTSRAIAVPGLRIEVAPGWPADGATIVSTIRAHPLLLVTGMLGFCLRGGILLLAVPILVLPTSVEVRLLLGDNLGSNGLSPGFFITIGALAIVTMVVALLVLYALARCELSAFGRFVNSAAPSAEHAWIPPGRLPPASRRSATSRMFVIEALALLAVLLAAIPLFAALGQATISEIVLPSSSDSIYARILSDVSVPIVGFIAALFVIEAVSAIAARRTMARAFGLGRHERIVHHPLRVLAVALVGWVLLIGALVIALPAVQLAWEAVRSVYLSTGLSGGVRDIAGALVVALMFGAVFAAALFVCGLISAARAGLWTLASLR